jgi:hypothetical protein
MPRSASTGRRRRGAAARPGIPPVVQADLIERLERHAAEQWAGRCRAVEVRFRGAFAYVDAISAETSDRWGGSRGHGEETEDSTTHLCRLGYIGRADLWAFAFYKYSDAKYEPSFLPTGAFEGTPEEAFDCSAGVYLGA